MEPWRPVGAPQRPVRVSQRLFGAPQRPVWALLWSVGALQKLVGAPQRPFEAPKRLNI